MTLEAGVKELAEAVGADVKALANGKVNSNDPRLTDAREWSEATVPQAEAEAGTASTRRAWTAQRVRQAIAAWYSTVSTTFTRTLLGRSTAAQIRGDLGLGTAATRNVGESSGNVMQVGAFGLGGDSIDVTDFNNLRFGSFFIARKEWTGGGGAADNAPIPDRAFVGFSQASPAGKLILSTATRSGWASHVTPTRHFLSAASDLDRELIHCELTHDKNLRTTTGQSTLYPMSQKAVTDAINGVSDRRDKVDITPSGVGLDLLEKLEPVSFRLNKRDWYRAQAATTVETSVDTEGVQTQAEKVDSEVLSNHLTDYDDNDGSLARDDKYTGLIAQDVKAALEDLGLGDLVIIKNYSDEYEGGDDRHYIEYNGLIPVMINAIKELSDRVKELETRD